MYKIIEKIFEKESPSSIFEVGCANGSLFKEYSDQKKVGGLDINPVMGAKIQYPEYADNFIQFDARKENWPIPDNSYDIVFTVGTMLLLEDPTITIREMLRIAKDKIILAEPHNEIEKIDGGLYGPRYIRDYIKFFKGLNMMCFFNKILSTFIFSIKLINCII